MVHVALRRGRLAPPVSVTIPRIRSHTSDARPRLRDRPRLAYQHDVVGLPAGRSHFLRVLLAHRHHSGGHEQSNRAERTHRVCIRIYSAGPAASSHDVSASRPFLSRDKITALTRAVSKLLVTSPCLKP